MPTVATTAFSRIANTEHVCTLSRRDFGYMQAVLSDFELHRRRHGRRLQIDVPDDPQTIVDGQGKRCIESEARADGAPGLPELQRQLADFESNPNLLACRFDCANWPMRFSNGGVLPVLHLDGRDYFLMFYRDIFPIGWNIANGASDNTDEWLDPTRIIEREFGEEVLLCDPTAKRLFIHDPPGPARPVGFHEEAIGAWKCKRPEIGKYDRVPMPLKWIDGPDSVHVTFRGRTHSSEGVFLSVTPPDHGIEVDRVALIRLSGDIRVLDGEIVREKLLNHVVGLFDISSFGTLDRDDFRPDRVFFDGEQFDDPGQLDASIGRYLQHVQSSGLRRDDQVAFYNQATTRFDLCPISRAVIGRYFDWLRLDQQFSARQTPVVPPTERDKQPPEIFISHRSTNVSHARALHDFLESRGHNVFFSDETLAKLGDSDYMRSISWALGQARILILLALNPQDLDSEWVDFEWKAFNCEILSRRKQGQIFSLLHNVSIEQLPLPLRSRQSIAYSPASPFDSFENLYKYLNPATRR